MDLTFSVFHATIPRVRYIAITPVPRSPQIAPSLLRDLRDPRVKIPTPPVLPTLRAHRPTHSLPSFSTPSKHGPHTKTRKPFPLYRLLHTSLYTGENGRSRTHPSRCRPLLFPSAARRPLITPLNAMLTKNKGCASPHPQQSPPNFQPATTRTRPFLFSFSTLDCRSKIPVRSGLSTSFAELFLSRAAITVSPLSATFTENQGAPPNFAPPPSSPLTTHYSLPQSFRYTMLSGEP